MYSSSVKWIFAIAFMDLFAMSLIMPLMSAHLRSLGVSHFLIGVLGSTYSGLQLFSGPVVGSWSDIRGRRAVLLFTMAVSTICYFSIGFANTLPVIFLLRFVLGSLKHTQTLCKALVADVVPPDEQPAVGGRLASYSSMGFMVGPALAGHLFESDNGFSLVCNIVAILCLVNVGIVYLSLPPENSVLQREKEDIRVGEGGFLPAKRELARATTELANVDWSRYWDVFTQKFLVGLAMSNFFIHYGFVIQEWYGAPPSWIGYTVSFQGFVSVVSGFLVKRLDRFYAGNENYNTRTLHCFVVLVLSFVFLSYAPSLAVFAIGLVPLSASSSLLRIVGNDIIIQRTPPDKRGSLVGAGNSVSSISRMLAPLIAGLIYDVVGVSGVFLFSIASSLGGVLLSYGLVHQENKHRKYK